uniref:Uncharacterized protein n=1 Tax=Rhizophora mucronata TaxID=61149 RepID=A0A2P2N530_RHIMU
MKSSMSTVYNRKETGKPIS